MHFHLGCEFFKEYRENDHWAQGLHYDWSQVQQEDLLSVLYTFLNSQWLMLILICHLDCATVS